MIAPSTVMERTTARASRVRPLVLGELLVIAFLLVAYDRVRAFAHVQRATALAHGVAILGFEHDLHLEIEPTLNHWLTAHAMISRVAVDYYQYLHVIVAMGLLIACYLRRPHAYRPARNALLLVNAVGLAVYAVYPVAPPRLLPGSTFIDTVARAGFGAHHSGLIPLNQYAAMPSLHLAWATWTLLVGFALTESVWWRCLLVAHPLVTGFVVLATANHYGLDVLMGVVLAVSAVAVASSVRFGTARAWKDKVRLT